MKVKCPVIECRFNEDGECKCETLELDYPNKLEYEPDDNEGNPLLACIAAEAKPEE